ncbi:beta-glucanase (GH16 family) [Lewinella marina]|nr:family 16 glycosylhydrolase [Neolewinella marina]NJB85962.1 beta-glucanase (GH16 family) [Neolewinella marina]
MLRNILALVGCLLLTAVLSAQGDEPRPPMPFSDPNNQGGWVLNPEVSDEFDGSELDTTKWFIEGQDGRYYIWKGRAPAQFAPHNVIVEDGKLKLRTQWEPDYPFDQGGYSESGSDPYGAFEGQPLPVTTAGVVTKKRFLNGYMEVRSKAGHAAITAAFWAIGYEQELDVYEQMGAPKIDGSILSNSVRTAVHDWSPPAVRPTQAFGYDEKNLPYRTSDDFHVYGAEWGEDYLKIYRDGRLTYHVTQDELGTDWVLNNPMEIWLDSEAFSWLGLPHAAELPVDFEIDYVRVWQKPDDNLLDRAFYGFEGPILYQDKPRPLDLVPESSVPNEYQKFWLLDTASAKYLSIIEGEYATGVNSLEFRGLEKNETLTVDKVVALSPEGAVDLPAGEYTLSVKVWLDQGRAPETLHLGLEDPEVVIPVPLEGIERRKWVELEKCFRKTTPSSAADQFRIEIRQSSLPDLRPARLLIDDIRIRPVE